MVSKCHETLGAERIRARAHQKLKPNVLSERRADTRVHNRQTHADARAPGVTHARAHAPRHAHAHVHARTHAHSCQDDDSGGAAAGKSKKQSVKFDLLLSDSDRRKSTLDGSIPVLNRDAAAQCLRRPWKCWQNAVPVQCPYSARC